MTSNPRITPPRPADTIGWVDFLRVLAVFLVVLAHCCDAFTGSFDTDRTAFLSGVTIGSLTRPSDFIFVYMAYDLFDIAGLAPWARILCGAVVASAASLVLCLIFDRWRPTRRLIA